MKKYTLWIALILLADTLYVYGQDGLSPEQITTIRLLKQELNMHAIGYRKDFCSINDSQDIERALSNLDPILVGENVVFGKAWLNVLSRTQLEIFRERADKIYNAQTDLIGSTPKYGEKIFIDFVSKVGILAHSHYESNIICFNRNRSGYNYTNWDEIGERLSSIDDTLAHEIGHTFSSNTKWWSKKATEAWAIFLADYALEKLDNEFGKKFRNDNYNHAYNKFHGGGLRSIGPTDSEYEYLLLALVDNVGWDTIKKAFRSYNNPGYPPRQTFFDRIEHFKER